VDFQCGSAAGRDGASEWRDALRQRALPGEESFECAILPPVWSSIAAGAARRGATGGGMVTAAPIQAENENRAPVAAAPVDRNQFATAILRSFSRSYHDRLSWGVGKTMLLGALSLGIVPALVWPRRFRDYVTVERQQLWHWATWLSWESKTPEAAQLVSEVESIRARGYPLFSLLILGCVAFAIFGQNPISFSYDSRSLVVWNVVLGCAFLAHMSRIVSHEDAVRRVVDRFNAFARSGQVPPVQLPPRSYHTFVPWMILGFMGCLVGAVWAIPMALAGAMHRRYINETSRHLRDEAAARVRQLMEHDLDDAESLQFPRKSCRRPQCRARIRENARFCPRCGIAVTAKSEVA
jgi:hypothetical protein